MDSASVICNQTRRPASARYWLAALGVACLAHAAHAFPYIDNNIDYTPGGTAIPPGTTPLSGPDAKDLAHQLQLANGLPAQGMAPGWTIEPRIGLSEALTDNVYQVNSPMRWDLTTLFSPSVAIAGQTAHAQVRLNYAPILVINARTGSLNSLNQQLNGTASVTVIDDLAFIDLRALSGIQSLRGAAGAGGTIGASELGGLTAGSTIGYGGTGLGGITQQNAFQTSSVGISPYLMRRFGDYGTARIGYSLDISQSSPLTGFQYFPFPTGSGSQRLVTQEQTAQFKTGSFLNNFQDTIDIDFSQSHASGQNIGGGSIFLNSSLASNRQLFSNTLSYAVNHSLIVSASIGHERIVYTGFGQQTIDDMTWSVGATYSPNPNSSLTISYGHQQGANSASFSGRYMVTPRTTLSASYSETLGTQLENIQQQLNQGVIGANGSFLNAQTGGPLFGAANTAPLQSGIFRFKNLTASATTVLDRDSISLTVNSTNQNSVGGSTTALGSSQTSNGIIVQWTRELRPDLRLATSASYGVIVGGTNGSSRSVAFNAGIIYTLTETVSASARYSFFRSMSSNTAFNLYEDIFVVGVTKRF